MIKVIVCKDYEEVSDKAAEIMLDVVKSNPKAVLGLATGSSPIGLYQRMIKDHQENNTSYAEITTFNLDEYVGLNPDHPQSYHTFMHENLFNHLDIKNVNLPSVLGDDMQVTVMPITNYCQNIALIFNYWVSVLMDTWLSMNREHP